MLVKNDIEVAGDIFTRVFKSILDKHVDNDVPYLANDRKKEMLKRDELKKTAASSGTIEDCDAYKDKRNEISTKLKTAKAVTKCAST